MSKTSADQALNSVLGTNTAAVAEGDKVTLVGFGIFSQGKRAAREGRNPQTGKPMQIPPRNVVKFKAGKKNVDAVN